MKTDQTIVLKTLYGNYSVEKPLIDLIQTSTMQRLKHINQSGPIKYSEPHYKEFSRYDHSIGVLALLKRYHATIKEQIAGLLHDASHTVFSHVADFLFEHKSLDSSYQDEIHENFLKQQKIDVLLKQYGFNLHDLLHKSGHHTILEQDLPDMCADRLEYNLHCGLNANLIDKKDIELILNNLKFADENWFFTNVAIAKKFAFLPLHMTEKIWTSPLNVLIYQWMAQALKKAFELAIITADDIHFSTDDMVWNKLNASKNKEILHLLDKIKNPRTYFKAGNPQHYDQILHGKFRGINPLVKIDSNLIRLTVLDSSFKNAFEKVNQKVENGSYIIFLT